MSLICVCVCVCRDNRWSKNWGIFKQRKYSDTLIASLDPLATNFLEAPQLYATIPRSLEVEAHPGVGGWVPLHSLAGSPAFDWKPRAPRRLWLP